MYFLKIYTALRTPAIPCENIVATAAPATPHFTTTTRNKSRNILITVDTAINTVDFLLSPKAIRSPKQKLYRTVNGSPKNIITRYTCASLNIFSGVFNHVKKSPLIDAVTAVIMTAIASAK